LREVVATITEPCGAIDVLRIDRNHEKGMRRLARGTPED
jgi:hypothetical protein